MKLSHEFVFDCYQSSQVTGFRRSWFEGGEDLKLTRYEIIDWSDWLTWRLFLNSLSPIEANTLFGYITEISFCCPGCFWEPTFRLEHTLDVNFLLVEKVLEFSKIQGNKRLFESSQLRVDYSEDCKVSIISCSPNSEYESFLVVPFLNNRRYTRIQKNFIDSVLRSNRKGKWEMENGRTRKCRFYGWDENFMTFCYGLLLENNVFIFAHHLFFPEKWN